MKIQTCLFISFASVLVSFGQSKEIKWWESQTIGSEALHLSRVLRDGDNLYLASGLFTRYGSSDPIVFMINGNGVIAKKETLNRDVNGESIRLIGLVSDQGELFGYYFTTNGKAIVYRNRIDKSSLKFSGQPLKLFEGKQTSIDMINPIWEKDEQMNVYFGSDEDFEFIDAPFPGQHAILKRNSFAGKEPVELKIAVISDDLQILNNLDINLNSNNTNTRLYSVVTNQQGGVYLILGEFDEKLPRCSIHYYPASGGEVRKTVLPNLKYVHKISGLCYDGGLLLTGLRSENHKEYGSDYFMLFINPETLEINSEQILGKGDINDLIHMRTNGETCLAIVESYTPSVVVTSASGSKLSSRYSTGFNASLIDLDGKTIWTKAVANSVSAPGGGIMYDAIFPFVYNKQYFMIQNTHPETHQLIKSGGKIKTATYGKDRFATELISFHEDGMIDREYIYLREEKVVTVPIHTRYISDGQFLFYGDKAGLGNSIQFGILDLDKE